MQARGKVSVSLMSRRIWAYVPAALFGVLVFLPNMRGYFVADDWTVIARNVNAWQEGVRLFTRIRFGWYRPIFGLFIALCWKLFGPNPTGYHLIIIVLYTLMSIVVGALAESMTGDRRVGLLSTTFFAIHGAHAEPVLWISSANEVLAGLSVTLSMMNYVAFRRHGHAFWLLVAWLFYLLGIASKETAVFLPLMLIMYDCWFHFPSARRSVWRLLVPGMLFGAVGIAFVAFRLLAGSPYSTRVSLLRIGINLGYYAAVEVFALPDNYGYLTALPLWLREPLLPILAVGLATGSFTILAWLLVTRKSDLHHTYLRALAFGILWSLVALFPVILVATGRTAFLSSAGIAWSFAVLFVLVWSNVTRPEHKSWVLIALAFLTAANLLVSAYRVYWWRWAGDTSRETLALLDRYLADIPANSPVCLVGLPDHVKHAYTFRNAFPAAGWLLFPGRDIRTLLDVEVQGLTKQDAIALVSTQMDCSDCAIFWYEDGELEELP